MTDYMKKFSLKGKTAAVFGGLGLIGKEIVSALGQAGAKVLLIDIDEEKGHKIASELGAEFIELDITDIASYDEKISAIWKEQGQVDIVVNTAYPRTEDWGDKFEDVKSESWRKNVDMQMNSYCLLTIKFAELMKKNEIKGSIINLGSTYGVLGADFEIYKGTDLSCPPAYAAIKGGIINFSRHAASYYGKYGIRVNALCPGGIFDNQNPEFVKAYESKTSLKRMGNPEEIASAAVFLASDASSYVTGTAFMVDGGWTSI